MAATWCDGGKWTEVPLAAGDSLIHGSGGFWVTMDGTTPAELDAAYPNPNGADLVVKAGLILNVYPASKFGCRITVQPV